MISFWDHHFFGGKKTQTHQISQGPRAFCKEFCISTNFRGLWLPGRFLHFEHTTSVVSPGRRRDLAAKKRWKQLLLSSNLLHLIGGIQKLCPNCKLHIQIYTGEQFHVCDILYTDLLAVIGNPFLQFLTGFVENHEINASRL